VGDAGLEDCACTHRAGLQRDIEFRTLELPSPVPGRRLADGDHLGVGGRIARGFALVESLTRNLVVHNNDCTDGHFVLIQRQTGQINCPSHVILSCHTQTFLEIKKEMIEIISFELSVL
jgi:hypothetical protein